MEEIMEQIKANLILNDNDHLFDLIDRLDKKIEILQAEVNQINKFIKK